MSSSRLILDVDCLAAIGVLQADYSRTVGDLQGGQAWDALCSLRPQLNFGYETLTTSLGSRHLEEMNTIRNEGSGHFMFLCEIQPLIKGPNGWFGTPLSHLWQFDTQPVFVQSSWMFFEFLDVEWRDLLLQLGLAKVTNLPRHAVEQIPYSWSRD